MHRRWLATTAVAGCFGVLAALPAAAQSLEAGETFVFGDSLSDTGSRFAQSGGRDNPFAPGVTPNPALYNTAFPGSLADPTLGTPTERFSNGDIHVDTLAGDLTEVVGGFDPAPGAQPLPGTPISAPVNVNPGLTFDPEEAGPDGFNFAHGGAQTGLSDAAGDNVGFLSQVGAFATLQGGGQVQVDSQDTALVWIGGNDFFDAAQAGTLGAETVGTAVTNVGVGLNTLAASGVQNFVVYTLPDLSQVPLGDELAGTLPTPEAQQQALQDFSLLSTAFNAQLQTSVLNPLEAEGANVTVVDIEALFDDLARQPGAYGLRDATTHCFSLVSQSPTGDCTSAEEVAETTFLDSLHPTTSAQAIIAQFAQGTFFTNDTAASVLGTAPKFSLLAADGHNAVIASRLRAVRAGLRGPGFMGQSVPADGSAGLPTEGKISIFAYGNHNRGNRNRDSGLAGFDYTQELFTAGVDYEINDSVVVGLAAGYSSFDGDLDAGLGDNEIDSGQVSIYGTAVFDGFYSDLTALASFDDHEISRRTDGPLGDATGETDGQTFSLAVNGGYNFEIDNFTFGPTVGVRFLDSEIEDFQEDDAGALNLEVEDLDAKQLIGSIGAQAAARFTFGEGHVIAPQLGVSFEKDFEDEKFDVDARFPGGQRIIEEVGVGRKDTGIIDGGVVVGLSNGLTAALGGRISVGRDGGQDRSVRGRLRFTF